MARTTHPLILTVFPATTTSSFPRRNLNFPPNYNKPTAAAPLAISLAFHRHRSATRRPKLSPVRASDPSKQMGSNGSKETKGLSWMQPILRFAGNNVLPLVLVGLVALGLTYPSLGCAVDKYSLSKLGPFGIFVISGLMLRSEEIGAAIEAWPVGLFGLVSILFLTPYFSRIILQIQLQPQEFITGLAIFNCMPTTLSSGMALTQLAGGNSALALSMTVISNLLGILIVDSARKHGILLDVVQVLTDLNLSIKKAYISSDGRWFMDVFHVTDQNGNKLTDESVLRYIERFFLTAEESMDYYNQKRCIDGKGLVLPSQIRYVKYFERILTYFNGENPLAHRCMLRGFLLHRCPHSTVVRALHSCRILPLAVYSPCPFCVLFSTKKHPRTKELLPEDIWFSVPKKGVMVFALPGELGLTELAGDFKIHFHDRQGDFYWY